ncbi:DUF1080 domain-containing protein [candidate division KSB1 bacterium]
MRIIKMLTVYLLILSICVFCSKAKAETQTKKFVTALTNSEIEEGFTLLFDGNTTNGWRGYNKEIFPEKGWEIDNGALRCIANGKGGDIITEKEYGNFELKLEWKIAKGGNSGIFYRGKESKKDGIWKSAPEMQVLDNENHADAKKGRDGNRKAGTAYDLIPAVPQNARPYGEWNTVKIICRDTHIEHWMNEKKVLEYNTESDKWKKLVKNSKFAPYPEFGQIRKGHIALQDHGNDVWYRNIKIKVLK